VVASYSSVAADFMQVWVAKEAGLFEKHGLDVDLQSVTGAVGIASLLAGETQIDANGGPTLLGPVANGGDIAVVATPVPVYPYKLEVPASIRSNADLRGKKVGITSFGTSSDVGIRAALGKLGLTPDSDVSIVQLGSTAARIAALEKGEIQGTVGEPVDTIPLEGKGFHPLFDLASLGLPAANGVIDVKRSWINSNRDSVQKYVDAIVDAGVLEKKDKAFALQVLKKYLKVDDQAALEASYGYFVEQIFPPLPAPKPEQFTGSIEELGKKDPKVQALDANKIIDASFVQDAAKRGLGQP
jgi:NitT/TauT family transport system substrate-binding protein